MLKTLTTEMTPEQYAEFLYEYSCQGGWQKVQYKVWSQRLYEIGWSERFWTRYKQLKGISEEIEKYADYIERVQEEEAREQGLIL